MTRNEPARPRLPRVAALLLAALGPAVAAESTVNPQEIDELCRRIFDTIDEPAIRFGLQGHELRPSAHAALDRIVNFSRNCPHATIVIIGHSDSVGDESVNLLISRMRAQSVADYLQRGGIRQERLRVEGRGSSEPIASNDSVGGRAKNRRIELRLVLPAIGG